MKKSVILGFFSALVSGCGLPKEGVPLYPVHGERVRRADVALIVGDVTKVDGEPVPAGERAFEVLPGCHTVSTPQNLAGGDQSGATFAQVPEHRFAVWMKAGHSYVVTLEFRTYNRATGYYRLTTKEYLPNGKLNKDPGFPAQCFPGARE